MNFLKLAIFLGFAFLLNGCFSASIDEKLLELETRYKSVTSYKEMRSINGGSTEYYFLLDNGELVARRTKGQDGSMSLDKYKEAQGYIIRGRQASRTHSAMFSLDLTFVPMGFSGFARFNRDLLTFSGYETIGETECAVFVSDGDKQQATFWIGVDDGIVRRHSYINEQLTMKTVVIDSTISEVNSVDRSKFELPSGVTMTKVGAQEEALSATIAELTRKQREESR
jgi:hypothetical protein